MKKAKKLSAIIITSFFPIILFFVLQALFAILLGLENIFDCSLHRWYATFFFGSSMELWEFTAVFNLIGLGFFYNLFKEDKSNKFSLVMKYLFYIAAALSGIYCFVFYSWEGNLSFYIQAPLYWLTFFIMPVSMIIVSIILIASNLINKLKTQLTIQNYTDSLTLTINMITKIYLVFSIISCVRVFFPPNGYINILDYTMKAQLYMLASLVILNLVNYKKSRYFKLYLIITSGIVGFYLLSLFVYDAVWHYYDYFNFAQYSIPFACAVVYAWYLGVFGDVDKIKMD